MANGIADYVRSLSEQDAAKMDGIERIVMALYKAAIQAATLGRDVDRMLVMTACEELASKLDISVSSVVKTIRDNQSRPVRSDQRHLGA